LPRAASQHDLAQHLAKLDIKYVALAVENDYRGYTYLDDQPGLLSVHKDTKLTLYRNEAWRNR
jgi:hypothetical protein